MKLSKNLKFFQKILLNLIKCLSVALVIPLCWKCHLVDGASTVIESTLAKPKQINYPKPLDSSSNNIDAIETFTEYHIDHEVSEKEAKKYLDGIRYEDLNESNNNIILILN